MGKINLSFFELAFGPFGETNPNSSGICKARQNSSFPIPGINVYEGIPINLALNITIWLLFLLLFTILRKVAWGYGLIALITRNDDRSGRSGLLKEQLKESTESIGTNLRWNENCLWICRFLRLSDEKIVQRCGRDAYIYLLFQRYLTVYVCLISFLSLLIILPVNLSGVYFTSNNQFGSSTIANSETRYLWIHSGMSLIYFLFAIAFMQRFICRVELMEEQSKEICDTCTLMISNIERPNKEAITEYLSNQFSNEAIADIQFAYDVTALTKLNAKLKWTTKARQNSERQSNNQIETDVSYLYPYPCGWFCRCCFSEDCGCKKVNAVEFYRKQEERLHAEIKTEKTRTMSKPLGILFLTLKDTETAKHVYDEFYFQTPYDSSSTTATGSSIADTTVISTNSWQVQFAAPADNIIWENLSIFGFEWWLRAILINTAVFIVCFFFTTPVILLEKSERFLHQVVSSVFNEFLPTLLLWLFTALLPNLVYYGDQFIGHWTRYSENQTILTKTFIFLVLMVTIIPSLGLTSVQGILESNIGERYQCIFATDNVAFFVNYVVTSAFIGTGLELLRLPELIFYCFRLMLIRSPAERSAARQVYDFQFGFHYAWLLCIMAVILTYSIPCPLIAPCGLIYLIAKQAVDRYNIYFAYRPLRINMALHKSAGNLFASAAILIPVCVLSFISLRMSEGKAVIPQPIVIFAFIALIISILVFIDHVRFGFLKSFSCCFFDKFWTGTVSEILEEGNPTKHGTYVADVLISSETGTSDLNHANPVRENYGAIC